VQELIGHWTNNTKGEREFVEAELPILSRVLYARMDNDGKLVNVNSGSWEGRQ
jgi:hypothetical protein